MKNYTLKITGRVQGVFFRARTKDKAEELDVKGFVRNEEDSSVYIECEGDEENLEKFLEWCHKGPEKARVENVEIKESRPKHYTSFRIERE